MASKNSKFALLLIQMFDDTLGIPLETLLGKVNVWPTRGVWTDRIIPPSGGDARDCPRGSRETHHKSEKHNGQYESEGQQRYCGQDTASQCPRSVTRQTSSFAFEVFMNQAWFFFFFARCPTGKAEPLRLATWDRQISSVSLMVSKNRTRKRILKVRKQYCVLPG